MRGGVDNWWSHQGVSKHSLWQLPKDHKSKRFDDRAAYTNPKWPWIQAVFRVAIRGHLPRQYHVQRIEAPRTVNTYGPHVLHFMWRGYTGCMDIDVLRDDKVIQNTSKEIWATAPAARSSSASTTPPLTLARIGSALPTKARTFCREARLQIVPPPGQLNTIGETHEQALATTKNFCSTRQSVARRVTPSSARH